MRTKIFTGLTILILLAIVNPLNAAVSVSNNPVSIPVTEPRAEQLAQRLQEIKGMNTAEMSRLEKKSLRKEVRAIKKEMAAIKGGVYLSVGAIIIIILLLILLV